MIYHIVMWNFKPEVEEGKKPEIKAEMAQNLKGLVGQVPGHLTVEFVENPILSSTQDLALVTTLEKAEDISIYATHPAHVHVADTYVRPYVCDRVCLDCEL